MNFEDFKKYAKHNKIVPVYQKITADMLTPVLAYLKIRGKNKFSFLLESVEGIGRLARFSFIGVDPVKTFSSRGQIITIQENGSSKSIDENLFEFLKKEIKKYSHPEIKELPDFTGGLVGYIGFENVALIEDVIKFTGKDELEIPDSYFGLFKSVIAFDHYKHQLLLISNVQPDQFNSIEKAYQAGVDEVSKLKSQITQQVEYKSDFKLLSDSFENFSHEEFYEVVNKSKNNIYEGDVFQLVPSKRFESEFEGDLFNVYRALRMINPSPHMYFMEIGKELTIIGTSPEDLVQVKDRKATILPIAGTRRRGKNEKEDLQLEEELLNDPKEIAEHMMLVDLARNDLGRVCNFDTIKVVEDQTIHRFSHVMHIVSRVEGELHEGKDCMDAFVASFPAGTVSGAPKIRAIQLINEYEQLKRGVYSGAVGYIDFGGNLDMCIAIRTLFAKSNKVYWQAGAGIVADSQPKLELKEIRNKAEALLKALKYAEVIDENFDD